MSLQEKSRRRLLYVVLGALLLAGLAGGGAVVRLQYIRQRAMRGRADGLASMTQGDYASALTQFGTYLSRYPNDADILLPYAKARQSVEEPNGHHLGQAIALYQRVLELRPGLPEAQQSLLDLYVQVGFNTEANGMATTILARDPNNTDAWRAKVIASLRTRKFSDAKKDVQQLTKVSPLDLDFRILELEIAMNTDGREKIRSYANDIAQAHPNDARFELLKSIAASFAQEPTAAKTIVQPLVARPLVDATYTRVLIRQLDSLELFEEAYQVLEQAAKGNMDREITRTWVRRLFETNRFPLLIEQTAALDPADRKTDAEILAMRVFALARLNRHPEAAQILAALEKRGQTEPPAARWAAALHATALRDSSDPVQTIKLIRDALITSPGNPILLQELGDAYAAAGAHDKASTIWTEVTRMAPAWAAPFVRLSQTFVAGGQPARALEEANAAALRAREDHDAAVAVAVASAANLRGGPSAEATNVLELIDKTQKRFPQDLDLLPLKAGLLAQIQRREAAIALIQSTLAADPAPPERTLLSLAQVSETFQLGQEEACWTTGQKAYGLTADLAFARAMWLNQHKRETEALALLEKARAAHPANDPLWHSMWAEYLDRINDGRAKAEWIALGDQNSKNVKLQWAALGARTVQTDHDFVGRTIDRLVDLLGEDSLTLRLIRARWLLQGQASDKDTTQASILLSDISRNAPDMLAPRLLLAGCYMRLGNISGAIDELVAVSDMQPDLTRVALEAARLLQVRGDFQRAAQYIDRACQSRQVTLEDKHQAASLLAQQREFTKALALLEKAYGEKPPPDLLLAFLYLQTNQLAKTENICRQLLEKPEADTISFAADFYAGQNQPEKAQQALALLKGLKISPENPAGTKELILAHYAARYGSSEEALKQFQAAAQAAPQASQVWQQLIAYSISIGKIDEALVAADQAVRQLSHAESYGTFYQNAALVKEAAGIAGTRPLLMTLASDPSAKAPVLEALGLVATAKKQNETLKVTLQKLRPLADRNPHVLALQTLTLQLYMESGQMDDAVTMATRAVQAFPSAIEPLREATAVLGAAQRWDEALDTAREWRQRDPADALEADLAIAGAQLKLGDARAAMQRIQPYFERARQDPEKFSGVILLWAEELLASRQPEEVEKLLGPLLAKSERWRSVWLSLAAGSLDDPKRAQAWLEKVTPMITDNINERTHLAESWLTLGARWTNTEFQQKGTKMLQAIAAAPDAPIRSLLAWGSACEAGADWAGAEQAYRRALQRDPGIAVALNNLAIVLVRKQGNLDEAQQLITKALAMDPKQPAFLDTQATVLAAQRDYKGATAKLREAQRLDPQRLEWHVNLLAIQTDFGNTIDAKNEMQTIDALLLSSKNTPPEIRRRYEQLRAKLQ